MRTQLFAYQNAGVIDVEEEFHQRCFHITVYKSYAAGSQTHRSPQIVAAPSPARIGFARCTTLSADVTPNNR